MLFTKYVASENFPGLNLKYFIHADQIILYYYNIIQNYLFFSEQDNINYLSVPVDLMSFKIGFKRSLF